MKYTVRDIKRKIQAVEEYQFCRVDIDGKAIGTAVVGDLKEALHKLMGMDESRTISSLLLYDRKIPIHESIAFIPLNGKEVFDIAIGQSNLPKPSPVRIPSEEPEKSPLRRMYWNNNTKLTTDFMKHLIDTTPPIKIRSDVKEERKEVETVTKTSLIRRKVKKEDEGLFTKVRKWLKGDKGYKK